MSYEYYAENHDWDLTLRASWNLVMAGQAVKEKSEFVFSFFTGGMLLSFCAIESFINSTAFVMSGHERYSGFNYGKYVRQSSFWNRFKMLGPHLGIKVDTSREPFRMVEEMRVWRNALVHSSPYSVEPTKLQHTNDSRILHDRFRSKEYARDVTVTRAKSFYECAYQVIELVKNASGLEPRAMCSYKVL